MKWTKDKPTRKGWYFVCDTVNGVPHGTACLTEAKGMGLCRRRLLESEAHGLVRDAPPHYGMGWTDLGAGRLRRKALQPKLILLARKTLFALLW